jgi:hypothetical protein
MVLHTWYLVQLVVHFVEDEGLVIVSSVTLHNIMNYMYGKK